MTANPHTPPSLASIIQAVQDEAAWYGRSSLDSERQIGALLREAVRLLHFNTPPSVTVQCHCGATTASVQGYSLPAESLQAPSPGGQIVELVNKLIEEAIINGPAHFPGDAPSLLVTNARTALLTAITELEQKNGGLNALIEHYEEVIEDRHAMIKELHAQREEAVRAAEARLSAIERARDADFEKLLLAHKIDVIAWMHAWRDEEQSSVLKAEMEKSHRAVLGHYYAKLGALQALFAERHFLGAPLTAGKYDTNVVMVSRAWYDAVKALVPAAPTNQPNS